MKTVYFDCRTGAAGDMIVGALLGLVPDADAAVRRLNAMGVPGVVMTAADAVRGGLKGVSVEVSVHGEVEGHHHNDAGHDHHHHHHHHHATPAEIDAVIGALNVSDDVKRHVREVYALIAGAEAEAHGVPVSEVHFHEVGAMDAVADIASAALLIEELGPVRVLAAVPEVGGGFVRCAHGLLPVPAPATVNILKGVPFTSGAADCELMTPTGAALLVHYASAFGPCPAIAVERTGCGCGARELADRPNVLRAFLGDVCDGGTGTGGPNGRVVELKANIDDMTGEDLAHACERLRAEAGVLDVSLAPLAMKKGRAGHLLVVLATPERADATAAAVLRETSTFGVRRADMERYELARRVEAGADGVRVKTGEGWGVVKSKREFADRVKIDKR